MKDERVGVVDDAAERTRGDGPMFSVGDAVAFRTRVRDLSGVVCGVDYRGRERECFGGCDWSYDIMVERRPDTGEPCMFKHMPEGCVRPADGAPAA